MECPGVLFLVDSGPSEACPSVIVLVGSRHSGECLSLSGQWS